MTNESELRDLANTVRQTQHGNDVIELVFNPETGAFEQCPKGEVKEGEIVTQMTKEGFA